MPPKPKFTREEMIEAAVEIVRRDGEDALTARNLGSYLGASARPIFTVFESMDEVREAVKERAHEIFMKYREKMCDELEVPYTVVKTEIAPIIFDHRKEKNPCSLCSKMRRGALNQTLLERGFNKLALGHHYDDAVETFIMSLLFEGRISCFQPVTRLDRTGITQIRPMLYIHEKTVDNFAARQGLPVLTNRCPVDKVTKREEVKQLIFTLSQTYPDLKERIFGAMQRYPLPEWEPHGRYKRPKEQE